MFVWTGDGPPQGTPGSDEGWMELWNHVTMRYQRHADGSLVPLPQRSVDTGIGLERLLMVLEGKPSVFEADVFEPWLSTLPGLWQPDQRSLRLPGAAHRAAASRSATAATAARSSGRLRHGTGSGSRPATPRHTSPDYWWCRSGRIAYRRRCAQDGPSAA